MGLVRMVRPWDEWLVVWGYDISEPPPDVDEEEATRVAHNLIGDDTIEVTLRSTSLWGNNKMYATRYVEGRVFCMGDACHRHPPCNGLGSNTSIRDAYNLAWKLALVLQGKAAPSLLDTYDAERAPIGRQIVLRANQSIEEFGPIFEASGCSTPPTPSRCGPTWRPQGELAARGAGAREAARRDRAQELRVQRPRRRAGPALSLRARSSPTGRRSPRTRATPSSTTPPTTWPGARLPHCWLERGGERVSTHDLAGKGRFTLLTGIGGEAWVAGRGRDLRAHGRGDRGVRDRPGARCPRHL